MSTHIGNDRCTRCGGGSNHCPVCNPVERFKIPFAVMGGVIACIALLIFVFHQQ